MSEPIEQLKTTLKSHGYSLTRPRRAVFAALQNAEPQTMYALVDLCPAVDRASVYRTVALYESLGIVQRLQIGWKYRLELTDSFVHHHHHLTCVHCGSVTALPEDHALEQRLVSLARQYNFVAHDHQLEIRGLCSNCSASG